jgi:hypothetical protein
VGRSYLVGGYKLPFFFTTCKTKDENISTTSLIEDSSFERSAIDLVISRPQRILHSSNPFFAQSSACLLIF